ncbi:hypothetical protein [Piscinibacter gummiphilus]|uniref:Uncharacterized protein n=1 Tax=Piscinibacter gummiphilus TaxID=946333 RepID=A0A1W6LAB7_9BURK|nr:hypothetical protein [Piscinibacter gummiphilus]ARN21176.1 hypothetical protein A4W93_15445 [Piscinibacter gummiphilus]ATU65859.1 hypothetical protein CPZ87_15525 [Piscinibacter gummiphilus]
MNFRTSLAAVKLLFRSMDAVRDIPERASDLRQRALALRDPAVPMDRSREPTLLPSAEDDQADYVALLGLTNDDPPAVFSNGMALLSNRAARLAARTGLSPRRAFVRLLDDLKDAGHLDFEAYALLRDLASLASDALRAPPEHITRTAALDVALAVRGAHRLLARLIAAEPDKARRG